MVILGLGILWLAVLLRNPNMEFFYGRSTTEPFPNQRFARVVFLIVGAVLVVGGVWGLWIDWRAGP
jgi:uncharacterized membrane protein